MTYARDVMTGTVASVRLDVPVPEIAKLLLEKRISAVPVVNDDGVPLGMVSEGDLVGRDERDRLARSDWWLAIVKRGVSRWMTSSKPACKQPTVRRAMSCPCHW